MATPHQTGRVCGALAGRYHCAHVQLSPRLPCRQPRRRAQTHGADCHPATPSTKRRGLTVLDTHAGRVCTGWTATTRPPAPNPPTAFCAWWRSATPPALTPALRDYVDMVRAFNRARSRSPSGSPFIAQRLLRSGQAETVRAAPHRRTRLAGNVAQLEAGRQVADAA